MANQTKKGGNSATNRESNRPVKSFFRRGVRVSVFANPAKVEDRDEIFHKTVVTRAYKDGDEWKSTSSLGREDLPIASMLLTKAWEWILEAESNGNGKDE